MLTFRDLKASEIDCRIATVKPNGISLLLYKDARVDQNILDETVGPFNRQRWQGLLMDLLQVAKKQDLQHQRLPHRMKRDY